MSGFGQYDTGGGNARRMPTAIYDLAIVDADVKRDGSGNVIRDPKSDKARFAAKLKVASGEFAGENLTRTMNVTYAPSQDGNYGPFAQFIAAATGIPCGDPRQKAVGRDDLRGLMIRALVKHSNGYNNVTEFVTDTPPAAQPSRPLVDPDRDVARAQTQSATTSTPFTVDFLLSELPFPVATSIKKLGEWAGLSEPALAVKIGFFSGRAPLTIEHVEALKAKIRDERAA